MKAPKAETVQKVIAAAILIAMIIVIANGEGRLIPFMRGTEGR